MQALHTGSPDKLHGMMSVCSTIEQRLLQGPAFAGTTHDSNIYGRPLKLAAKLTYPLLFIVRMPASAVTVLFQIIDLLRSHRPTSIQNSTH